MPTRPSTPLLAALLLATAAALPAQVAEQVAKGRSAFVVHLGAAANGNRAQLLGAARDAVRRGRAAPELSQALRSNAAAAARGVVDAALQRGGEIRVVLTVPPAVVVESGAAPELRSELAARTDVARIEDLVTFSGDTGDAANASNHNVRFVQHTIGLTGAGQTLALVDSGVELRFLGGPDPHPALLDATGSSRIVRTWSTQGTALLDLSDRNGHGTGVGAVAVGRQWSAPPAADGFAPAATLASYRVTSGTGTQTTNVDLALAYGQVLLDRIGGLSIGACNCSFSGSPDPLAIDQRALDELALYGDVLVVTSAGKLSLPPNFDFRASAASQAATNGIAVGAATKNTHAIAPFSVFGPLDGDGARVYPDLTAVGAAVRVADRAGSGTVLVDGTSYAAPMVAGTALLVRQARPDLDAVAVKAVLLGTADDLRAANPTLTANWFGRGFLRSDRAVATALAALTGFSNGDPNGAHLERGSTAQDAATVVRLDLPASATLSATLVWQRSDSSAVGNPDLDLEVRDVTTGALLGRGNLPRNVYERVVFTTTAAPASATCEFVIRGRDVPGDDAAWALLVNRADGAPPSAGATALAGGCPGTAIDLAAQLVLPALPPGTFGGARTNKPLADVPLVLQAAYDAAQLGTPRTVRALALRRAAQEGASSPLTVQLRVTLGYTAHAPDSLSTALVSNFVATPAPLVVFDAALALPPTAAVPAAADFDFVIPLAPAFSLDPAHGNLLVQLEVLGNDHNDAPQPLGFDAVAVTTGTSRGALVQVQGSPFALPIDQRPVLVFATDAPRGHTARLTLFGEPRIASTTIATLLDGRENALALLAFGGGATWLGQPLPLDLAPFGAPGCALAAPPDEVAAVVTDATGRAGVDLAFPNDAALIGTLHRLQYVLVDPAANPGGMAASDGIELLLGG